MADPDIFKRGRGRKTTCLPRRHLSQMHIVNYTRFIREKLLTKKNLRPKGGDAPIASPLNLPLYATS